MTNLWEVAVLILAVTFMVVNVWQMYLSSKMLQKYMPFMDKFMKVGDKALDWLIKQYEDELDDK